ncbi:MAG: hypothetical protein V1779_09350 [bacterium]
MMLIIAGPCVVESKEMLNEIASELKKLGREDIMIVGGGVIPPQDYQFLYDNGASFIFGPGTVIPIAAKKVLEMMMGI